MVLTMNKQPHNTNHDEMLLNGISGLSQMFEQLAPIVGSFADDMTALMEACVTPIENDAELEKRMALIDELYSYAGSEEDISANFAVMVADKVYEYEHERLVIPEVEPGEALAFFMEDRKVKQKDLKKIASQSVISEILNGKRKMTVEHIKGFSRFFGLPEKTFMG